MTGFELDFNKPINEVRADLIELITAMTGRVPPDEEIDKMMAQFLSDLDMIDTGIKN